MFQLCVLRRNVNRKSSLVKFAYSKTITKAGHGNEVTVIVGIYLLGCQKKTFFHEFMSFNEKIAFLIPLLSYDTIFIFFFVVVLKL